MNMVLHAMLVATQSSIDISNHLIAENKLKKPFTYREAFEILNESGLISLPLSESMSVLAGFRNASRIIRALGLADGLTYDEDVTFF